MNQIINILVKSKNVLLGATIMRGLFKSITAYLGKRNKSKRNIKDVIQSTREISNIVKNEYEANKEIKKYLKDKNVVFKIKYEYSKSFEFVSSTINDFLDFINYKNKIKNDEKLLRYGILLIVIGLVFSMPFFIDIIGILNNLLELFLSFFEITLASEKALSLPFIINAIIYIITLLFAVSKVLGLIMLLFGFFLINLFVSIQVIYKE